MIKLHRNIKWHVCHNFLEYQSDDKKILSHHSENKSHPNNFQIRFETFIFENNFSKRQEINRCVETAFELSPPPSYHPYQRLLKLFCLEIIRGCWLTCENRNWWKKIHWNNFTADFTRLGIFHHFYTNLPLTWWHQKQWWWWKNVEYQ